MKEMPSTPSHGHIAEFRVGAVLATEAIAIYVDSQGCSAPHNGSSKFDDLPDRLKVRLLEACEEEFRRRKELVIQHGLARGEWELSDLGHDLRRIN